MRREINIRIPRFDGYKTLAFNLLVMTFFLTTAILNWIEGTQPQISLDTTAAIVVIVCAVNLLLRCVTDTPLLTPVSDYAGPEDHMYAPYEDHEYVAAFEQAKFERERDDQAEQQLEQVAEPGRHSHRVTSHAVETESLLQQAMAAAHAAEQDEAELLTEGAIVAADAVTDVAEQLDSALAHAAWPGSWPGELDEVEELTELLDREALDAAAALKAVEEMDDAEKQEIVAEAREALRKHAAEQKQNKSVDEAVEAR